MASLPTTSFFRAYKIHSKAPTMIETNHPYRATMRSIPSEAHFDASNSSSSVMIQSVAPVTPQRTISPLPTLPPPAPHKRPVYSMEDHVPLPIFPNLSDELMNDALFDGAPPSNSTRLGKLSMRIDENDDYMDTFLLTPSQPERTLPIEDFIVPKLIIKPRVASRYYKPVVDAQNLPPLPMLPALNPQDDPNEKPLIHLKLRPVDFSPEPRWLTAPTA